MASDSPDKKPLDPDAVTLSSDKLFPLGQEPLRAISGQWLRRLRLGGGRRPPHQPTKERPERGKDR